MEERETGREVTVVKVMRCLRALGLVLLLGGASVLSETSLAAGAVIELKFGHIGAPGSLFQIAADEFAKRANARLVGRAKVVVFGGGRMGKDKILLRRLKLGTVDLALPSFLMPLVAAEFGLFDMPYLVKSREHVRRIEKEIFWPRIAPVVEKKGYKIIALWENGFRHVTATRPVSVPAELTGINIRIPKCNWRDKSFRIYGAKPGLLRFSEVFAALKTGAIDAQENTLARIHDAGFFKVQKYLSMSGYLYTPAYVMVGKKKWATLPAGVRRVLEETAKETQAFVYEQAARIDREMLAKIKAGGMKVNVTDKAAFIEATKVVYDEFAVTVPGGREMLRTAKRLAGEQTGLLIPVP